MSARDCDGLGYIRDGLGYIRDGLGYIRDGLGYIRRCEAIAGRYPVTVRGTSGGIYSPSICACYAGPSERDEFFGRRDSLSIAL